MSAQEQYLTAKELAGVTGMPESHSAVVRRAKREGWESRQRSGRGGGREYSLASLPQDTQAALAAQQAREAAQTRLNVEADRSGLNAHAAREFGRVMKEAQQADDTQRQATKQTGMKQFVALAPTSDKRLRAKAREAVLLAMWDYMRRRGIPLRQAMGQFAELANVGEVTLPETVWQWMPEYQGSRAINAGTLRRWHYDYRAEGLWGLVDGYGARKGQFKVLEVEGLDKIIIGLMLEQPHITPKKVKLYLQARHPEKDRVSVKSYERFMKHWQQANAQAYTYATNPDAWKNQYMAAVGSHHERIARLNQVWEMDSTPGDWLLADGRHSVIGVIDLYSRRLKYIVSKTSTAMAVCQVFRRATLDWGICEIARTDNGKDYVSSQFTSVLRDLEVEQELCTPFASEQKGSVERAFRTMSHGILDMLPGFVGHNVAERKVIEARKSFAQRMMTPGETVEVEMTSDELQKLLDQWSEIYHHTPHSGLDGKTPFEMATAWTAPVRRIGDERALDMLLAEVGGTRVIGKKGVRFEGNTYDAPELFEHVGREAVLKRAESDIGRLHVYVEGAFVAVAECAELLGISRKERAAASTRAQKQLMAAQSKEMREHRKLINQNIGRVVLEHQLEQIANIETLHRPSLDYTPEGLRQASRAASRELPPIPEPATPAQSDARQKLVAEMAGEAAPVAEVDTPKRRFDRWVRLDRRVQAGDRLADADQRFHKSYPGTGEYRSMASVYEDLGLSAQSERS